MQLKKLHLLGFKTFADKTEIHIDAGMTAIVGPNGSGKSNIVDALLWVLGEQNPRLLRGNNAQDVIFNGTDKRKPLGLAEVRLTIDNSDKTLPINFAEVTVTRRVYRSGESQYLLNNSPCRLKDVVELFMDTGVGKGAYSFVSQSEIDAVLSARAEDRRELFEEAAGIKKYRVKKKEALRKLESAEINLNRIRDILHELEAQREPMANQAQIARRYLLLQERLHEIEVGLLVSELKKADYELAGGKQMRDEDQAAMLRFDAELAGLDRKSEEVTARLANAETEMDAAQQAQSNAHSRVERTESALALMAERGQAAEKNRERLTAELADIAAQMANLAAHIEIDRGDLAEAETLETNRRTEWAGQQAAFKELEAAVQNALRQVEAHQGERLRLAQERAGREAAHRNAAERLTELTARNERMARDAETLAATFDDAQIRLDAAINSRDEKESARKIAADSRLKVEARGRELGTAQTGNRADLDKMRRTQAEQNSRLNTLTELQNNHEGFYQGVRAVLNAEKKGQIRGHFRAVVDLLTVPEPYRVAIEVALGGSLQDVVTETEAEAKAGIQWLKENRAGRATFLPLPLLRPGNPLDIGRNGATNGVVGVGDQLVTFDNNYGKIAEMLLGRVLVVEDMDAAIAASKRMNGWSKIVTLEGELLTPGGALTGGSLQGKGAHLVGRKGEMDDLRTALPETKAEAERLTALVEANAAESAQLEAERNAFARDESKLGAEIAAADSARTGAEREIARMNQEKSDRENSAKHLAAQIADITATVAKIAGELQSGQAENVSADDALAALNDETKALLARRDECRTRAVALEVEVSRLREKREGLTRTLAGDRAALGALEIQQNQKRSQQNAVQTEGAEAVGERERLIAILAEAKTHLTAVGVEFAKWKTARQTLLAESFELNNSAKETLQRRADVTKNLHDTELRLARLEVQAAQALERLQEEYSISRDDALARPGEQSIDRNTAMEVGRLRRELRAMGQVNTGAVVEYERLTERFDFLTEQRGDLDKGRAALLSTISEIDDSTRGVFMETFDAVKVEFDRIFQRLFDGGTTKLILTNPDDILETGIDIIAQPPGKKPQSLSLLSGGERALTATALLFAFLAVKPSPFVLLDEVDAPLDGANVEKFTSLIKEFSERSQFLLITHNPVTMEAAPTWYGVTMKGAGVSSILSYRVPQTATITENDQAVVLAHLPKEPTRTLTALAGVEGN